jgi:hypothetical protein
MILTRNVVGRLRKTTKSLGIIITGWNSKRPLSQQRSEALFHGVNFSLLDEGRKEGKEEGSKEGRKEERDRASK